MTAPSGSLDNGGRRLTWLVAAALAGLLSIRLFALLVNGTDLFFDEAQYWWWSREPAFGYYSKPPLIAWIIGAATAVCGESEACIRAPAPLIHTLTAGAVFLLGTRLYDRRVGALAALTFATLPGVSLSAAIISTDVPLLLFWALALVAFTRYFETEAWWPALLLGASFGLGLNAKYAMGLFVACAVLYLLATPGRRKYLIDLRLWVGLAVGALLIAPNIAWNIDHSFATFQHTADNANWQGDLFHPLKALEFFGAQFGVFGPILFGTLIVITWRAWREGLPEPDRLLLFFVLPVIAVVTVQAFLSRAHANWAATAYAAATVLVVATMIRDKEWVWLKASLWLHAALLAVLILGTSTAGRLASPIGADPFARMLGWREVAAATRDVLQEARAAGRPFAAVVTDDRPITAELLYYMQGEETPVLALRTGGRPRDHFELTRPLTPEAGEPVLLVSFGPNREQLAQNFASIAEVRTVALPAGKTVIRRVTFLSLSGYKRK